MLNKLTLTVQLAVLSAFMGLSVMVVAGFGYHMIGRSVHRFMDMDRQDMPLTLAVSEITRQQLDQVLRVNEAILYGEVEDRGKFEIANEGFINAGRRLNNSLVEARNIIQDSMENAESEEDKRRAEKIKNIFVDFQKTHSNFEHLSGATMRNIYKYRFLTKAEIVTGNSHRILVDVEKEYLKNLSANVSAINDETKHLESKLKLAFDVTRELSRHLGTETSKWYDFSGVIYGMLLVLSAGGGALLLRSIVIIQQQRSLDQANTLRRIADPFRKQHEIVRTAAQNLHLVMTQMGKSDDRRREVIKTLTHAVTTVNNLNSESQRIIAELETHSERIKTRAENVDVAMANVKDLGGQMVVLCEKLLAQMQLLNNMSIRVNLLATSASAESSRQETSRGYVVFTDEIKNLSMDVIRSIQFVDDLVQSIHKTVTTGREETVLANEAMASVVEDAGRLIGWSSATGVNSHKLAELIVQFQGELGLLHDLSMADLHLLQQHGSAHDEVSDQTTAMAGVLDALLNYVGERRAMDRRHP
ncbi:MAG: hypothetical protein HQL73_02520 [Magnetococcales bacterium]|nr:hypothetical protein [Magnetococcales bacterium]